MAHFSATNTLTNYINESELGDFSSSKSLESVGQTSINQQLSDLRIQFKKSMTHLQSKNVPIQSLKPSLSMPQLPLFNDKLFKKKIMTRKTTNLSRRNISNGFNGLNFKSFDHIDALNSCSESSSSSTTHSESNESLNENVNNYRNNIVNNKSNEINQKLDLLINIINSQQKLLQNLIKKTNKKRQCKTKRKIKMKSKSTQTGTSIGIPHIVPSVETNQKSQVSVYPPIPESQIVPNNNNNLNNNVSVPCDMLLKLLNAVTNSKVQTLSHQRCQHDYNLMPPINEQYSLQQEHLNNNSNNDINNKHLMSPKSTLYFSD